MSAGAPQPPGRGTPPPPAPRDGRAAKAGRLARSSTALSAHGEPMVWLTGGALAAALAMVVGLVSLIVYQGMATFWPGKVVLTRTHDGGVHMGEMSRAEIFNPAEDVFASLAPAAAEKARSEVAANGGAAGRSLCRVGNFDLTGEHYRWISDFEIADRSEPEWALVIERLSWGRFYGTPKGFETDAMAVASEPAAIWALFNLHHGRARELVGERRHIEQHEVAAVNRRLDKARLNARAALLRHGADSPVHRSATKIVEETDAWARGEFERFNARILELNKESQRHELVMAASGGEEKRLALAEIVRAYPANQLGTWARLRVYLSRWAEFLTDEPREANSEGGVWPAIFGTVAMTLIMTLLVVPFGVLAALYLHEYAKAGWIVSMVRIAVNNLAGVPSIVFGVFGLGFFCYILGGGIDRTLFPASLPNPTFGKGGLIWAAFTLALLTLPVVIVATEEALSAVPNSMREGSYGCGASKWQTIRRIVLPSAIPGILTGMILAMARGAGEVAPLMLVGAVKLAPELPFDGVFPFVHPERSFMHLGFHIFDLGFQSPNSEAAKPMVFTTTLLLLLIVVSLNLTGILMRARLRKYFQSSRF